MPLLSKEADLFPPDLFRRFDSSKPWWVARVRSRQEKLLARHLHQRAVPFYLPTAEKTVRRAGRRRVSYLPLFPGYLFFRGDGEDRLAALKSRVVVHLLEVRDQARLEAELATLWGLQEAGLPLIPHDYLGVGDAIEIVDGPFKGYCGRIVREPGSLKLVVSITLLRRSVAVTLEREAVVPLRGAESRVA